MSSISPSDLPWRIELEGLAGVAPLQEMITLARDMRVGMVSRRAMVCTFGSPTQRPCRRWCALPSEWPKRCAPATHSLVALLERGLARRLGAVCNGFSLTHTHTHLSLARLLFPQGILHRALTRHPSNTNCRPHCVMALLVAISALCAFVLLSTACLSWSTRRIV